MGGRGGYSIFKFNFAYTFDIDNQDAEKREHHYP